MEQLLVRAATQEVAAIPPPPGVTQNFVDPPISGNAAYVLTAVGVSIAGLLLVLRLYTKGVILKKFGLDDVAITLAFAFSTADCALILEGRKYGTGKHLWDIPITTLVPMWGKIVTAAVVVYCPAIMFSKIAVLLCYLRISTKSMFRTSVYIVMGVVFSYNIALMLSLIFACRPIAKNWDATITTGTCVNRPAVYLANGVLNVVTDFVILLMPAPLIKGLHLPIRQKLLLAAVFGVGSLTAVISIIRLRTLIPTLHAIDQTWALSNPGNWIIVEINLAVTCGCLSVIRPFLRHHFPSLMGETRNNHSEQYAKASRSDYFSRSNRSAHRPHESSTESKSRLSQGNNHLPTWDAVAYSHDGSGQIMPPSTRAIHKPSSYSSDDVEMGDINAENDTADFEKAAAYAHAKKLRGGSAPTNEIGLARDVPHEHGIVKTTEVDIQR